jgi:hypothetical protein
MSIPHVLIAFEIEVFLLLKLFVGTLTHLQTNLYLKNGVFWA